jgi:hypothetical protein
MESAVLEKAEKTRRKETVKGALQPACSPEVLFGIIHVSLTLFCCSFIASTDLL